MSVPYACCPHTVVKRFVFSFLLLKSIYVDLYFNTYVQHNEYGPDGREYIVTVVWTPSQQIINIGDNIFLYFTNVENIFVLYLPENLYKLVAWFNSTVWRSKVNG